MWLALRCLTSFAGGGHLAHHRGGRPGEQRLRGAPAAIPVVVARGRTRSGRSSAFERSRCVGRLASR
jgi:hypothetical protein